ncbi:UNVERIFIED_CONTAM: hypothetical protein GTU68_002851 [Idotea baltica]|nr:hypothetical protein [Idotea baltica]
MMLFGLYIARREKSKNAKDYFLADKSLPWWAVGGSLIASNISAEQMIGMAGSGFAIGFAISSYELMAAATLIIVAKFLLPVFLKNDIYTMPQFIEQRFDSRVRVGLAIFWVLLFVFVNITSLFYLGGLAIENIFGVSFMTAVLCLAVYSATFSIFGGLKAVVWTDVIQVVVLILGGTIASVMILNAVSDGGGVIAGLSTLLEKAPEKFDIATGEEKSAYDMLPGLSVLIGGMWIANLYYWGFNQYIIQRALAAKSIKEAQKGVAFAALIKLFIPFIVVIPGIAAFVLNADISKADEAYPWVLNNFVGTGFKGIAVAALVAAIGSSLSSMANSVSTIFTLDIYKTAFNRNASDSQLVNVGKITAALSLIIGIIVSPRLADFGEAFSAIQKFTGYFSPGILAIFLFGLFWKKTTTPAALTAVFIALPLSWGIDMYSGLPFIDQMGICFLIISAVLIGVSLVTQNSSDNAKAVQLEDGIFSTSMSFNLASILIFGILAAIYAVWW